MLKLLTKMISKRLAKAYCRDDITLIENYDKADYDTTQSWHCHHRRETIYSAKELIEIGEYYNRPACELIFLTPLEHYRLHYSGEKSPRCGKPSTFKGKHHSEETRKKMSEARKGKNHPFFGKHHSEKTRRKMSKAHIGKHWYNNGVISVLARECPDGFVKGRIC